MTSTVFTSGTLIESPWLNDVNTATYTTVPSNSASIATLNSSAGSNNVGYTPAGTGAVATTVQTKLRESVSVKDFGATGNGSTNDTAAIQLAVTAAYTNGKSLYFPAGTYLMSSTITMGNTTATAATYCHFYGDGNNSVIKVTAANVNPFLWQGPNPNVDGTGNRIDGRILIEKLRFLGPTSANTNTNSTNSHRFTNSVSVSAASKYLSQNNWISPGGKRYYFRTVECSVH
jgi:hypothetical protein